MTANPTRGEVDVTIHDEDGHEKTYILRLTTNALCSLQARTGRTFIQLAASLSEADLVAFRDLMKACLERFHGDEFKTDEAVGDFIDAAGGLAGLTEPVKLLFERNTVARKALAAGGSDPNVATAPAGTGVSFTPTPVKPA